MIFDMLKFKLLVPVNEEKSMVSIHWYNVANWIGLWWLKWSGMAWYILFTLRMEIDAANCPFYLIKANIVETLKACSGYCSYSMIGNKEVLFPSHKDVFALKNVAVREIRSFCLFCQGPPGRKTRPMVHIDFLCGTPCFMSGLKCMLISDDFSFEESRQCRVILR